jgi:hypothetical protein
MKEEITMLPLARQCTAALIAIIITSSSALSAAALSRGEDPEFRAAWKALQAKENSSRGIRTADRTSKRISMSIPIEAIGDSARDICLAVRNRITYTSVDVFSVFAGESFCEELDGKYGRRLAGDCGTAGTLHQAAHWHAYC